MDEWSSFLREVDQTIINLSKGRCDIVFFRGQGNASWPLVPSLGRGYIHPDYEGILYHDFITNAGPLIASNSTSWDILFTMRHHSLPTRLLDWTEIFSVALYFAVKDFYRRAAIWILNPFHLNRHSVREGVIFNPQNDFAHEYYDYFIAESQPIKGDVIAIQPTKINQRVIAQKGGFTLHRPLDRGLELLFPNCVKKIELPRAALKDAIKFLKLAGINEYSLFPDLDGLSRWLRKTHGL